MRSDSICVHVGELPHKVIARQYGGRVVSFTPHGHLASPKESINGVSRFTLTSLHEALSRGWILNKSDDVDMISHHHKSYDLDGIQALRDCQSALED